MATLAGTLGDYFAGFTAKNIPRSQVDTIKRLLLDFLGVTTAGSRTPSGKLAIGHCSITGGAPEATVIGRKLLTSCQQAAFSNAISAHSLELDDVDSRALFHFGPPIIAAALSACEAVGGSGLDLLLGVGGGCEMMSRLSQAANPALRDRGYHTTAVCGAFGAAIAAGLILHLTAEQMTSALGLAGAQASGLMEMYGPSMQKRFNAGPAARNGVTAATLAQMGFTGTDTIFEGERGFARAFCGGTFDPLALTRGLGTEFPVEIEFKAYACARPIHSAIDACLELRPQVLASLHDIQEIVVRRHPAWADYHLNPSPNTYHEAQVSLPFSVAVALKEGRALFEEYQDPYLSDSLIRTLAARVRVVKDPALQTEVTVGVVLKMSLGTVDEVIVPYPKGSLQNPLSRVEMESKFRRLAGQVLPAAALDELQAQVTGLEDVLSIREMTALVRTG